MVDVVVVQDAQVWSSVVCAAAGVGYALYSGSDVSESLAWRCGIVVMESGEMDVILQSGGYIGKSTYLRHLHPNEPWLVAD